MPIQTLSVHGIIQLISQNKVLAKAKELNMGGGKSSGSSAPVVTQEQKDAIKAQTDFLTGTALPAYQETIGAAKDAAYASTMNAIPAMRTALNAAESGGTTSLQQGESALNTGVSNLGQLFSPQYKEEQVQAALQAGRESARESQLGQNAMYGASGGLGSSRMALADRNLSSLNAQRQATAAATAASGVEANRAAAAGKLADVGATNIGQGANLFAGRVALSQTPQDILSKYASVIYGTPQASTTPSFTGTQGANTSSKGFRI